MNSKKILFLSILCVAFSTFSSCDKLWEEKEAESEKQNEVVYEDKIDLLEMGKEFIDSVKLEKENEDR